MYNILLIFGGRHSISDIFQWCSLSFYIYRFKVEHTDMTPSQGHGLRLEPLHKKGQSKTEDDLEKQVSRLSESNNKCCRCCGLTRSLGIHQAWFIQVTNAPTQPYPSSPPHPPPPPLPQLDWLVR